MTKKVLTKQRIPLLDLQAQYEPIKNEVMAAIQSVFDSKQFIMGSTITGLEADIAQYCETTYALGVSSGTDALILALMALNIGPGDEVITTPFTFFATGGSIARVGAVPVFVDIEPDTYTIDTTKIEAAITSKTKAIMPVHLFGQLADMDAIMAIAKQYNLVVIEDAAQAIGATYKGKKAGSIGDIGCFSFFPSKNLGACGDGGMVTTNNPELYEKMHVLRVHGAKPQYVHHVIGGNFRLDAMQAAILRVKLPHLESQHDGRIANAKYYDAHLQGPFTKPVNKYNGRMIYNQYTIQVNGQARDSLKAHLESHTVGCAIYYPIPLHVQACFSNLGYTHGDCPVAELAAESVLSLPIYSELSQDQLAYVVETLHAFFEY
ncbi:transcriptional regulator [bacterium]|nr:transcriptional regulator [bacterium]|tara:strand:- start:615 stop:1745 length:1131 start_codon:yes stop_codon:yes gene_type:complete